MIQYKKYLVNKKKEVVSALNILEKLTHKVLIIIDDTGSGYSEGDQLVFVNTDTGGDNAEAEVKTIRSFLQLEAGTLNEHTIY